MWNDIVRKLQLCAVIFSDAYTDVCWVGDEQGHAAAPPWKHLSLSRFQDKLLMDRDT